MIGLDAFDLSNATAVFELKHPGTREPIIGDDGKPFTITFRSADHKEVVAKRDARINDRLAHGGPVVTVDGLQKQTIDLLVDAAVSWNLVWKGEAPECTPQKAREIFTEAAWLREDADNFVGTRRNFLKG